MCDGTLTLLFKDGACCWYPNTNPWYFDLAITWGGPGEFVWKFLYRILPYRLIALPCPPAGCTTTTTVQSSLNPANAGDSITFTATVTNPAGSLVPQGTVEFFDGAVDLGPGSVLSGTGASATSTFTTSALAAGSHAITAKFTGTGGWQASQGSLTQTVNSNITVTCCGNPLPQTLHATLQNSVNCSCASGTIALVWNAGTSTWTGTGSVGTCGHQITLNFSCPSGSTCNGFTLQWAFPDSCGTGSSQTPSSCACSPLNVVFSSLDMNGCGCPGGSIQVTITT
jgi:hypothetical protein